MELVAGSALAVAGIGAAFYFWSHPRRTRVTIELVEVAFIAPHLMGLDIGLRLGTRNLRNLYLLELTVTNRGPSDAADAQAADPRSIQKRPRIDLPLHFKVPQVPWLHSPFEAAGDVRVTANLREADGQRRQSLAIHIHHLGARVTVKHRLIATCETERPTGSFGLSTEEVTFFPGTIRDVRVTGSGLLGTPPDSLRS